MNGRRVYHARGKVLGGSSSINGMIFQRGNPLDFERWAADPGMESWDYAHCLPYFKRMESCLAGADEYRGGDGPLVLERGPAKGPALRRVLRGRAAGGLPAHRRRERRTARRASRGSTATSTAAGGSARRARTSTRSWAGRTSRCGRGVLVDRVLFDGTRAVGVERRAGEVDPRRKRSSSAAARSTRRSSCSSPAWATRPSSEPLGIDVVADLPGVGENLQDHLEVYVQHACTQPVSVAAVAEEVASGR